jgi:ribonuclease HI
MPNCIRRRDRSTVFRVLRAHHILHLLLTASASMMVARPFRSPLARGLVAAFVPTPVAQRCRVSIPRSAKRSFSSTVLYEAAARPNLKVDEEDLPRSMREGPPAVRTKGGLRRNSLSIANQQSGGLVLLASATSSRLGTGVGVALVVQDGPSDASGAADFDGGAMTSSTTTTSATATTTSTSFGVYFQQYRSLYEREYTALIVALQWLQQNPPAAVTSSITITLPIREDVVYHQLLGAYPVEKESLRVLHRVAVELIQNLQVQLALCPKAAPFQQCQNISNRVLLMERSDRDFVTFVDPLDPYSSSTSAEAESLETEHLLFQSEEFYGDNKIIPMLESLDDYDPSLGFGKEQDGTFGRMTNQRDALAQQPCDAAARPEIDPNRTYLLQFDGGARGNPHGPSGCGMVIYDEQRNQIWSGAKYLGEHMTNNQAEYTGIVLGLQNAVALGIRKLKCQGDSELIIKQLKGQYKVKNDGLKPLHRAAVEAMGSFDVFEAEHIVRKDNAVADSLANQAMDTKTSIGF